MTKRINGKRLDRKHKQLGAKKIKPPASDDGGKKGGPGCLPALVTVAALGGGWASMLWQGWSA